MGWLGLVREYLEKYFESFLFGTGLHRLVKRLVPPSRAYLSRQELKRKELYTAAGFIDAARHRDRLDDLRLFLQAEMSVNIAADGGETALIAAARADNRAVVELLLEQPEIDVNVSDHNRETALIAAAGANHLRLVEVLLRAEKIDVNARNAASDTALILAAAAGRVDLARALLAHPKTDVDVRNATGETAWLKAIRSRCREIDGDLERRGADAHGVAKWRMRLALEDQGIFTPQAFVDRCQMAGKIDEVRAFLTAGIDVNASGSAGNTGLIVACGEAHLDVVELLLEQPKIDVNARNDEHDTALIVASRAGREEVVRRLLRRSDVNVNAHNRARESALLEAARRDFDPISDLLRERGADEPNLNAKAARWKIDRSPHAFSRPEFLSLVRGGQRDWVERFLTAGIDVEAVDDAGNTALILAAEADDRPLMEVLLEHGAAVNATNRRVDTALIAAAKLGRLQAVECLLGQHGIDVNARNSAGESALLVAAKGEHDAVVGALEAGGAEHPDLECELARWRFDQQDQWREELFVQAAGWGRLELVDRYLLAGMDPDARDGQGNTALILAAKNAHDKVVRVLLQQKIDVNARNDADTSALTAAAGREHREVVDLLLAARADRRDLERALRWRLEERGHAFRPVAFLRMAEIGQDALVEVYLDAGMAVDAPDRDGNTALILAAAQGHLSVVRLLLQRRADVDLRNRFGCTALEAATRTGHEQVAELLRRKGATLPQASAVGLLSAVEAGDLEGVREALAEGAAPDAKNEGGEPGLITAVRTNRAEVVALLLDHDADVDARDSDGKTPLMVAAELGRLEFAAALLERGAAVDAVTPDGSTALMLAAWRGHAEMVDLLAEHGADVDRLDSQARAPLTAARAKNHGEVERVLERRGASRGAGRAALLAAAEAGDLDGVRALLDDDDARMARDERSNTPVMLAARRGWIRIVEALLDREPDLEQTNADGDTALMLAAAAGWRPVVEALLDKGARIDACNSEGRTALLQATAAGKGQVVTLLAERGANHALAAGGTTPLVEICRHGPASAVAALLAAGADVEQRAGFGHSALMAASLAGQAGIVDLLRQRGARAGWGEATLFRRVRIGDEQGVQALDLQALNLEARDERGRSVLLEAASRGQAAVVGALLAAGASPNVRALNGETALKLAAASGSRPALGILIEHTQRDEAADTAALLAAAERGHASAVGLLAEKTDARIDGIGSGRVPLVVAAARGHLEVVATLYELRANVAKRAADGQTALTAARLHGHRQVVAFLESHGARGATGDVDLLVAAADGDVATVCRLLSPPRSANPDARDPAGRTPLMRACEKGRTQVVEVLIGTAGTDLERAAAIGATDLRGRTPLMWAAIGGELQIVSMLLPDARVHPRSEEGRTALLEACRHGWPEIVEELLAAMTDEERRSAVNATDHDGKTPLTEAFLAAYPEREQNYTRIVELLERYGAELGREEAEFLDAARRCETEKLEALLEQVEVDGPRRLGKTALMLAAETGCIEGAQLLLDAGASIDAPGPFGATPLILAMRAGQLDSIRLLLERNADRDARDSRGETALHAAVKNGAEPAVEILISAEASVDLADREGRTPLMRAVLDHNPVLVLRLLEAGASTDVEDDWSRTALTLAHLSGRRSGLTEAGLDDGWNGIGGLTPIERHLLGHDARRGWNEAELLLAARDGDAGEVDRLLGEELEVQAPDLEGSTALLWACRRGDLGMARLLLDAGSSPDVRNDQGSTPLLESVEHCSRALAEALLRPGLSLDDRDREGDSALLKAAKKGASDLVVLLAEAGANPNLGDRRRYTPLLAAAGHCHLPAVRCLLERGANACSRSADHRTAVMEAAERGDLEVLRLLLTHVQSRLRFSERLAYLNAVARVDNRPSTALDLAERSGHAACVELLRREGAKSVQLTGYTVYLTETGDYYHRYTCGACAWGRRRGTLAEIPIDSARLKHYPPCDKCNPSYREAKFDWIC